jgi:hypothetical protein
VLVKDMTDVHLIGAIHHARWQAKNRYNRLAWARGDSKYDLLPAEPHHVYPVYPELIAEAERRGLTGVEWEPQG